MDLPVPGDRGSAQFDEDGDSTGLAQKNYSRDVLKIEICGPGRSQFSIIDVPGIFHTSTREQNIKDAREVNDMVDSYIKEDRTIIM